MSVKLRAQPDSRGDSEWTVVQIDLRAGPQIRKGDRRPPGSARNPGDRRTVHDHQTGVSRTSEGTASAHNGE
jgi:hypothetical protein